MKSRQFRASNEITTLNVVTWQARAYILGVELNLQAMVMPIFDTEAALDASQPRPPLGLSTPQPGGVFDAETTQNHSVNVAVFAPDLERVEVVFQAPGEPWRAHILSNVQDGVHFGLVDGMPPGTRYGFRAAPSEGGLPLSIPALDLDDDGDQPLLLDPYGRAVDQRGEFLTSVHVETGFDWGDDQRRERLCALR